jgi:hypothetical protein
MLLAEAKPDKDRLSGGQEKETIDLPLEVKLEELAQVPIGSDASIDISEKINLVERILNFTPTPLPLRS